MKRILSLLFLALLFVFSPTRVSAANTYKIKTDAPNLIRMNTWDKSPSYKLEFFYKGKPVKYYSLEAREANINELADQVFVSKVFVTNKDRQIKMCLDSPSDGNLPLDSQSFYYISRRSNKLKTTTVKAVFSQRTGKWNDEHTVFTPTGTKRLGTASIRVRVKVKTKNVQATAKIIRCKYYKRQHIIVMKVTNYSGIAMTIFSRNAKVASGEKIHNQKLRFSGSRFCVRIGANRTKTIRWVIRKPDKGKHPNYTEIFSYWKSGGQKQYVKVDREGSAYKSDSKWLDTKPNMELE